MIIQWQPIDTVPKDGSWFLVFSPEVMGTKYESNYSVGISYYSEDRERAFPTTKGIRRLAGYSYRDLPTHWMPIPPPPPVGGLNG